MKPKIREAFIQEIKKRWRYNAFMMSALLTASLIYGYIHHTGILFAPK